MRAVTALIGIGTVERADGVDAGVRGWARVAAVHTLVDVGARDAADSAVAGDTLARGVIHTLRIDGT